MATVTKLKSGSWRVQVRRKGNYVSVTFLRRKNAEGWAIDEERRIDRGEPSTKRNRRDARTFGDLVRLHVADLHEVGKPIGRSKAASLHFLESRLGVSKIAELDRERLIQFGKERAREGAGPVTLGIDLGYIKTIFSHAAAVHGIPLSTEPIILARIALMRLGLVGKGNERDRRPTQGELDCIIAALEANPRLIIPVARIVRFGCWAPAKENLAIEQTSGRQRLNIHGALDLETGKTAMIDVETVDAASTIRLLEAIEAMYPLLVMIHVFLDNARYHHAKLVQEWLAQPGRRVTLHFIPAYCPNSNPIERLWGLMHKRLMHNKTYPTYREFAEATLTFLRERVPKNGLEFCDSVSDNFRLINPKDFRVPA